MRTRFVTFTAAALLASGLGFTAASAQQRPAAASPQSAAASVVVYKSAT
jgi:hypothetical protein